MNFLVTRHFFNFYKFYYNSLLVSAKMYFIVISYLFIYSVLDKFLYNSLFVPVLAEFHYNSSFLPACVNGNILATLPSCIN